MARNKHQYVIRKMSEPEVAEMIERHIDFCDDEGRSVHLPSPFVKHYMRRTDGGLPTIVAIATLPLVSGDGALIYTDGLDRKRGIVFIVEPAVMRLVPRREGCHPAPSPKP
jgi:hypothetical protein